MSEIYFDHSATTAVDERVFEAMKPYFTEEFGNANSAHQKGNRAKVAVEEARDKIAELIGAEPAEIIFTSGGTESDNTVIHGVVGATGKKEVITSPLEHHAILHTAEAQKKRGVKPIYVEPDDGIISPQKVEEAITDETAIVSLMHVNNEIGAVNPIVEIAEVCQKHEIPFHSDTVQSIGKIPVDVDKIGLDFLSMSAHKLYGPKGVGVLYMRYGTPWMPFMHGGSQERRRRGGTLNVPGIVGMAKALELAVENREDHYNHFKKLRNRLKEGLKQQYPQQVIINESEPNQVPHIINLTLTDEDGNGLDGEMLLLNLDMAGIFVSTGSACTSGAVQPSHVLSGIGIDDDLANSSIRLSLGKDNTAEEIDYFLQTLGKVLDQMKIAE